MSDTHSTAPAAATNEVSAEQAKEIDRQVGVYVKVAIVQVVFSLVTVAASYLPISSTSLRVALTLLVASANAYLVLGIMMHLKEEKRSIWNFLIVTAVLFFFLFFLTGLAHGDPIVGTSHTHH